MSHQHYVNLCAEYLRNAWQHVASGNAEKAGEALWGAAVSAANAFAVRCRGILLRQHGEVREFMRQLAFELGDPHLLEAFRDAERLHANFYHGFLDLKDVAEMAPRIEAAVRKVLSLPCKPATGNAP